MTRRCILHVTDHEYDRVLQLNHDAVAWSTRDETLLEHLEPILGPDVVEALRRCDECRMEKHDALNGLPRIEQDHAERADLTGRTT